MPERIETLHFTDDGQVPNSSLPLLVMRGAIIPDAADPASAFECAFAANGWTNSWRNGVYPFHHYHSNTHEVLGVARGRATLRLGGEAGRDVAVAAGDVVVIPAGVGHKRIDASDDFEVVGAYPDGRDWDLIRAENTDAESHAEFKARIANVPLPARDPVAGENGPLIAAWKARAP
jgi:uncharacterized protein YjlB